MRRDPRRERNQRRATMQAEPASRASSQVPCEPRAEARAVVRRDPRQERGRERREAQPKPLLLAENGAEILRIQSPRTWVLAVPDGTGGDLSGHDLDVLHGARSVADAIAGGVIAFTPIEAADYGRLGVDRVVPTTSGWTFDPETRIAAISALFNSFQPSHIILPETSSGGGHLGRLLATRLNLTLAAGVVRLKGAEVVRRVDGGRLDQTIAPAQVILLAPEAAEPVICPRREAQRLDYP